MDSIVEACSTPLLSATLASTSFVRESLNSIISVRGVSFRGIGQEPGWLLEITHGDKIVLRTGYGGTTEIFPFVSLEVSQAERRVRFVVKEDEFEIIVNGKECTDTMSGEIFQTEVLIELLDRNLTGCGRALH